MKEVWFWLPDWAGNMAIWEDDLVNVAPQADHTFVPYESMVAALDDVSRIPGIDKATTVVGWGLGALALMKSSASLKKSDWILLSPFADFCDDSGEWTQQNLRFMAKQCLTNPEPSLNTFAEVFENEFGDWQDDWMAAAKKVINNNRQGVDMTADVLSRLINVRDELQTLRRQMDYLQ